MFHLDHLLYSLKFRNLKKTTEFNVWHYLCFDSIYFILHFIYGSLEFNSQLKWTWTQFSLIETYIYTYINLSPPSSSSSSLLTFISTFCVLHSHISWFLFFLSFAFCRVFYVGLTIPKKPSFFKCMVPTEPNSFIRYQSWEWIRPFFLLFGDLRHLTFTLFSLTRLSTFRWIIFSLMRDQNGNWPSSSS